MDCVQKLYSFAVVRNGFSLALVVVVLSFSVVYAPTAIKFCDKQEAPSFTLSVLCFLCCCCLPYNVK